MIIFFDFDDVIFNTKKFKKDYFKIFKERGVPKKVFDECYYDPRDKEEVKNYDPRGHVQRICEKTGMDGSFFEKETEKFLEDTGGYVFPEVRKILHDFGKERLIILSFSETDFQKSKIYNAGILNLFSRVEIVNKMKGEAVLKIIQGNNFSDKKIFFVDDRAAQIEDVKITCPEVITVFCTRKEGRYRDKETKFCDHSIKNLKELEKIIKYGYSNDKK